MFKFYKPALTLSKFLYFSINRLVNPSLFFLSSSSTSLSYQNTESGILLKRQKRKSDRFGINKCESIEKLINLFQNPKFSLTLNELILLCYQITHLAPVHMLKSIYGLSEILPKIQAWISDVNLIDEDPLIGSLMLSLKTLNCYKNIDNWIHLLDLIMSDCFDAEADEVLKAMQGIDGLDLFLTEEWQKSLYDNAFIKIEMLLIENLKLMKYNIENLVNICEILIKNDRTNPEVFEEIDFQIYKYINGERQNTEVVLNLDNMINFSYFFAKAEYHSVNLFTFTNKMLVYEINKQKNDGFMLKGSKIGNLMHFWNFYKMKEISFELEEIVKNWLFKNSIDGNVDYNIDDLISMHNGLHLLEVNEENLIILRNHLEKKLLKIDTNNISKLNLSQIEKYFRLRAETECNNDYNQLSLEVYRFFDVLCSQTYERFHYRSVYDFFLMLENNHILNKFPSFFTILPKFIEMHSFQYEFEDVCYFYLLFISNTSLLNEEKSGEFYGALNNIKEFIKFIALRRGFKMDMDSNFHKLLSAIDLAHFFDGGEG